MEQNKSKISKIKNNILRMIYMQFKPGKIKTSFEDILGGKITKKSLDEITIKVRIMLSLGGKWRWL